MADRAVVDTASPLTIRYDSSDTAIPALTLASYAPVIGDRVAVDRLGGQVVVLGSTGAPRTRAGVVGVTFTAGVGVITFTPALPFTPAAIFLTPVLAGTGFALAQNQSVPMTSAGASIRAWELSTGAAYAGAMDVQYLAVEVV